MFLKACSNMGGLVAGKAAGDDVRTNDCGGFKAGLGGEVVDAVGWSASHGVLTQNSDAGNIEATGKVVAEPVGAHLSIVAGQCAAAHHGKKMRPSRYGRVGRHYPAGNRPSGSWRSSIAGLRTLIRSPRTQITPPRTRNTGLRCQITLLRSRIRLLRCLITGLRTLIRSLRGRNTCLRSLIRLSRCLIRSFRLVIRVRRSFCRWLRHQSTPTGRLNTDSGVESARDARHTRLNSS